MSENERASSYSSASAATRENAATTPAKPALVGRLRTKLLSVDLTTFLKSTLLFAGLCFVYTSVRVPTRDEQAAYDAVRNSRHGLETDRLLIDLANAPRGRGNLEGAALIRETIGQAQGR